MARTRIGTVQYLNAAPLTRDLDRSVVDVVADHPSAIAAALAAGDVDVALVPVAALLADGVDFRVVPGVCIGAEGPVDSVLLVGRQPAGTWKRVLLDGVSRTSVALTRVLAAGALADVLGSAELVDVPAGQAVALAGPDDGALVIGDAARHLPADLTERIDLAEVWHRATGLPFVFAVWAGRPGLDAAVQAELRRAADVGRAALADRYTGEDLVYLGERLRYDLDDRALMGLRRFAALGHGLGLFRTADVQLYGPDAVASPVPVDRFDDLAHAARGDGVDVATARRLATAPLAELAAAACAARDRRDRAVDVDVDGAPGLQVAVTDGLIDALADAGGRGVASVELTDPDDGVGFVRAVALARVMLPHARIGVAWTDANADLAVSALHAGADRLRVDGGQGDASAADRLGDVYCALREAGLAAQGLPELSRRARNRRGAAAL